MRSSSIMVHVTPTSLASNRVKLAAGLADRLGAVLIGVAARPANLVAFNDYGKLEDRLIKQALKVARDEVAAAEHLFRQAAGACSAVEWRETIDLPTRFLIEQARAADLIVVARQDKAVPEEGRFAVDLGDVLMEAGRPMLVAPPHLRTLAAERVVIAWKNTREARRVVRDSLPILKRANEVTVATIGDGGDSGVDDVRDYLQCRGIVATSYRGDEDEAAAGEQILALVKERGADLVVAGGYGHSRMREWIFGGLTRSLLEQAPVCCLLSH
jgi:nucleotide-binding universal stress UspA family protein